MAKYDRETVIDISDVNRELSKLAAALNSHLDRTGGAPNQMEADLDMNSNDVLNAGAIGTDSLSIGGVDVQPTELVNSDIPNQTGNGGKFLSTDGANTFWDTVSAGEYINIDDYITDPDNAGAAINQAANDARTSEKALVSWDASQTYTLEEAIDLSDIRHIHFKCRFQTSPIDGTAVASPETRNGYPSYWNNYCILLGDFSGRRGLHWVFEGNIMSANTSGEDEFTVRPQVSINGAKSGYIQFADVDYLRFYQEEDGGPPQVNSSCAYNRIQLTGLVRMFEVTGDYRQGYDAFPSQTENTNYVLWWNENKIHDGRIIKFYMKDRGYSNNHNKFYNNNFENTHAEIRIENGSQNYFYGQRFENARATFDISAITLAAEPTVTTETAHNLNAGDDVYIYNFGINGQGLDEFEDQWCQVVSVIDDNNFTIDVSTSGMTPYVYNPAVFNPRVLKPFLWFGVKSHMNYVERSWVSSIVPASDTQAISPVTGVWDAGVGNHYATTRSAVTRKHKVVGFNGDGLNICTSDSATIKSSTNPNIRLLQNSPTDRREFGNNRAFNPGIKYSHFNTSFVPLAQSALLPVKRGDTFSYWARAIAGGCRMVIYPYDENGDPLTIPADAQTTTYGPFDTRMWIHSTALNYISSDGVFATQIDGDGDYINSTGYMPEGAFTIWSDDIKFIRIGLQTGNNTNTVLDYVEVYYHEQIQGHNRLLARLDNEQSNLYLSEEPARGCAPHGTVVGTPEGDYQCTKAGWATLSSALTSGATSVTVDITANSAPYDWAIEAGDIVGILAPDGTTHWTTVSGGVSVGASTTTFTITDGMAQADGTPTTAVAGAPVYIGQWSKKDNNLVNTRTYSGSATNIEAPAHTNVYMECTNAAGCVLTLQRLAVDNLPVGTVLRFQQATAAGTVTIAAGTSATIVGPTATVAQYDVLTCIKYDDNEWHTHL